MTIPGNPTIEAAPYGAQPVLAVNGTQGGPYEVIRPHAIGLLASASRTTTTASGDVTNPGYRGLIIQWGVSVNPGGAQTLSLIVECLDTIGLVRYPVLTVPASATPGGDFLVYPGCGTAAVEGFSQVRGVPLPDFYQVRVVHSGVGAWTYYVEGVLLP